MNLLTASVLAQSHLLVVPMGLFIVTWRTINSRNLVNAWSLIPCNTKIYPLRKWEYLRINDETLGMMSCGQNCLQIMTGSIGSGITNVELVGSGTKEWFLNTVAEAVYSLKEKWQHLSVGCSKLDGFLQGGVAVQGITEIAGESSSGKTQFCLQMALTVHYPVINGGLSGGWCF